MTDRPECKLCEAGFLELKDLPCFPTDEVRWMSKATLAFGVIGLVLSFMGVILVVDGSGVKAFDVIALAAFALGSVALALIGAIFSAKKPTLQCNNCSATHPAS